MIVGDGSRGRDVDGGAPGAARARPEGAGGGVRGGGDRGLVGAGRPAAERAGDAGPARGRRGRVAPAGGRALARPAGRLAAVADRVDSPYAIDDRKSTRLNSSHSSISYAVFCL